LAEAGKYIFYLALPTDARYCVHNWRSETNQDRRHVRSCGKLSAMTGIGQTLNGLLERFLMKDNIRIDHFLAKKPSKYLCFALQPFRAGWNRHYIDHVQITVAESLGWNVGELL